MLTVHSPSYDGRLTATVSGMGDDSELWFAVPSDGEITGDPFVAALLPLAQATGNDLEMRGAPVSAALLAQIAQIQAIWSRWFGWKPIRVLVTPTEKRRAGEMIGCFFSGGLDSFYSLLKALHGPRKPTHLIFAHGFDIQLGAQEFYGEVRARIETVARELGVTPLFPACNIKQVTRQITDWGTQQHGAALAALALAMQDRFNTVIMPASHTYADAFPWGSHPLVDPLWSTESLTVVHDGAEATRVQKVAREIARSDVALAHLRVCWRSRTEYNCARCEKCIRTMVNLAAAGCLERCTTLPGKVTGEQLAAVLAAADENTAAFARENLEGLVARGLRPDLQAVLRNVVRTRRLKSRIRSIDDALLGGAIRRMVRPLARART